MIPARADLKIVVATRPVDFRAGMDRLAALVQTALAANPFGGDVFVFRAKRADRLKVLYWDGTGLVLAHKRLEQGRFVWPPIRDGVLALSATQLAILLDGLDWTTAVPRPVRRPTKVG
jgi:transposase